MEKKKKLRCLAVSYIDIHVVDLLFWKIIRFIILEIMSSTHEMLIHHLSTNFWNKIFECLVVSYIYIYSMYTFILYQYLHIVGPKWNYSCFLQCLSFVTCGWSWNKSYNHFLLYINESSLPRLWLCTKWYTISMTYHIWCIYFL